MNKHTKEALKITAGAVGLYFGVAFLNTMVLVGTSILFGPIVGLITTLLTLTGLFFGWIFMDIRKSLRASAEWTAQKQISDAIRRADTWRDVPSKFVVPEPDDVSYIKAVKP